MPKHIHIFLCPSFSDALELIILARAAGLAAAYLPHGGIDAHRDTPITHRVPIVGSPVRVNKFIQEVTK